MDAQQFLTAFGVVANAPGGVARLRELVLHLAVTGALVQVEHPADASPLLDRIQSRKDAHGEQRKVVPQQASTERAKHNVPAHWAVCRLGDLTLTITGGGTPSKSNRSYWTGDIPWASVKDLKSAKFIEDTEDHINEGGLANSSSNLIPPGRVIVCTRMGLGKIAINRVPLAINQDLKALELPPEVDTDFFLTLYKTREVKGTGTTVSGIKQAELLALPAALPPTDEQTRIVAKVDELMALCDRLEQQQQTRRKLQNALRQTTLAALANAQGPHALREAWSRLEASFGQLLSAPEDVADAVLELQNLAVSGLLSATPTASPDLERIKSDCNLLREEYADAGLFRRQKPVRTAGYEKTYPEHWGVIALDDAAVVIGGVTKGRNLRGKETVTCPYLAVANVQRGYFKLDGMKSIEITVDELEKYLVCEGDLLVTEGGDWDKVGRTAIWRGGGDKCLHQNHVFKVRIPSELLMGEWVELVFNSGIGRDYFAGASKQTTNLASINMTQLRGFPLPIPPLDEQQHILRVLNALTNQCTNWRQQLERKQKITARLATASIAALTGTRPSSAEAPMKAPQTTLIAPVRLGKAPRKQDNAPLATLLARHHGELDARELWQRFGGEVDAFYAQLKTEVQAGWIAEPAVAEVRETHAEAAEA